MSGAYVHRDGRRAERARILYVEGITDENGDIRWPTIPEVAELSGYSAKWLRNASSAGKWSDQRSRFQERFEKLRRERKAKALAAKAASLDELCLDASERAIRGVLHQIGKIEQAHNSEAPDVKELAGRLSQLMTAAERAQRIGRIAVGEAGDITRHELPQGFFTFVGGVGADEEPEAIEPTTEGAADVGDGKPADV